MQFRQLTNEQRRRFDEDGFLIVRGALNQQQVAEYEAISDRLIASDRIADRQNDSVTYDGFRNAVGVEPAYAPLLTHGATVPLVAQLLSPNIQLHTSHLIYKHPESAGVDPLKLSPCWHRDIGSVPDDLGWSGNQRLEIKVAYYLSDARAENSGVTMLARGSNRWTTPPTFDANGNPPNTILPDLAPGDALLFENRTYHAARVNTSKHTRKCIMFGYSYRWMRPDDWHEMPAALLERLDDVGRELVTPMRHRDAQGRFVVFGDRSAMKQWGEQHGVVGNAKWHERPTVSAAMA